MTTITDLARLLDAARDAAWALATAAPAVFIRDGNLICPACGTNPGELIEVDFDSRWNRASTVEGNPRRVYFDQQDGSYETVGFACDCCEALVTLPGDIEVTWS